MTATVELRHLGNSCAPRPGGFRLGGSSGLVDRFLRINVTSAVLAEVQIVLTNELLKCARGQPNETSLADAVSDRDNGNFASLYKSIVMTADTLRDKLAKF